MVAPMKNQCQHETTQQTIFSQMASTVRQQCYKNAANIPTLNILQINFIILILTVKKYFGMQLEKYRPIFIGKFTG